MRRTSSTPSTNSISRMSKSRRAPTAPRTVCWAPVERWMSKPISINLLMACWVCSSVAPSCITTTMLCHSLFLRILVLHGVPFERSCFVNNALKQPADGGVIQRALIRLHNVSQNLRLAFRLPGLHVQLFLDVTDFHRALRTVVEQLHQLLVNFVNALSPAVEIAHFSSPNRRLHRFHRSENNGKWKLETRNWRRPRLTLASFKFPVSSFRSGQSVDQPSFNQRTNCSIASAPPVEYRSSIACTKALPTTAASATA